MNRPAIPALLIASGAAMMAAPGHAGQVSATMPVTLVVQPACEVSATPLAFAGRAGRAIEAESQIAVACNGEVPLLITLDAGAYPHGSERRLAGEDGYVAYAVYSDPARRTPWAAGMPLAKIIEGGRVELAAYGRIEPSATLDASGAYADTVAITVDF